MILQTISIPVKSFLSWQDHDSLCTVAGSLLQIVPVLKNKSSASLNIIDSLTECFYKECMLGWKARLLLFLEYLFELYMQLYYSLTINFQFSVKKYKFMVHLCSLLQKIIKVMEKYIIVNLTGFC